MIAKLNGVHSKPSMNELGWWWQKNHLDDIEKDIEEAIMGFVFRFKCAPLHAIVFGPESTIPIRIHDLLVWQDPEVPEHVVVLQ